MNPPTDPPTDPLGDPPAGQVDPAAFRHVLGHVPTSVCVVTTTTARGPVGVTVGSFTSVSLDPPLVVFYGGLRSASARAIVDAGRFRVNVLAEDQHEVCAAFAGRAADRFGTGTWDLAAPAGPRLDGALAWLECDVEDSYPAGDHLAVVGRVRHPEAADGRRGPLVFQRGRLSRLDPATARHTPTHPFDWWGI
ncbi:hypothetical protein WN71_033975 [Streptomyces mangrovisoli]|uniref:Flavin reductase like domain-containing protein n=2 Tax=Streptomyces mangrovisoli TaxID=1428628 RepID=A0A1J4NM98_9ACTN|nr:hypothetical protein WN71_033975 [Streptomyces mangrovisoli]